VIRAFVAHRDARGPEEHDAPPALKILAPHQAAAHQPRAIAVAREVAAELREVAAARQATRESMGQASQSPVSPVNAVT
jgi:hypothetical protein